MAERPNFPGVDPPEREPESYDVGFDQEVFNGMLRAGMSTLPNRKFTCVEFPGYFKRHTTAIEALGGIHAIENAVQKKGMLQCSMRPEDPMGHPIFGDRSRTQDMLVRIKSRRRKKKHAPDGRPYTKEERQQLISTEVLGHVRHTIRFSGIADFQYVLPTNYNPFDNDFVKRAPQTSENALADEFQSFFGEEEEGNLPLHIPPPVFSRWDTPREYKFRQNPQSHVHHDATGLAIRRTNSKYIPVPRIPATKETPTGPPEQLLRYRSEPHYTDVIKKLDQMFHDRPIWSMKLVKLFMTRTERRVVKKCLQVVAYLFSAGPWRLLWVRFGYDPRQDRNAARYQVMDVRLKNCQIAQLRSGEDRNKTEFTPFRLKAKFVDQAAPFAPEAPTLGDRQEGGPLPWESLPLAPDQLFSVIFLRPELQAHVSNGSQIYVQWCDIDDGEVQGEINQPELTELDHTTGWFSQEQLEKLRIRLRLLWDHWFKTLPARENEDPIGMAHNPAASAAFHRGSGLLAQAEEAGGEKTGLLEEEGEDDPAFLESDSDMSE